MHRTLSRPWSLVGGLLLALFAGAGAAVARPGGQTHEPGGHLLVVIHGTIPLQLASKKPIKKVTNPKEGVVSIQTVERDPTTILVTGVGAGLTCLELEDGQGNKESYKILVQPDLEYLVLQLRKALPMANITPIPNGQASVILTGTVARAEDIQVALAVAGGANFQPINGLRVAGVQQVQLDVVLARVARTKGRNFGFNFLQSSRNELLGSTVGNIISPTASIGPGQTMQMITTPIAQSNIFGGVTFPASSFFYFLQALETEGLAKLLARPRVVTLSGNQGSILEGGEQAVPVPAGLGQVGVQFEEFGTRVNFFPLVLADGRIHLEVEPEVSELSAAAGVVIAGATVPGRQTQRVHTTVEMESGQTFVIGGLIQHTVIGSTTKIPVLGQLPFIGAAFSTKTYNEAESELIIMITPYLVDAQSCDQVVKVLPGQESRSPDDFELFLEGILEAPRGPRDVFHGPRYVPAHHTGPTADLFPCAGRDGCAGGACGGPAPLGPLAPAVDAPLAAGPAPEGAPLARGPVPPAKAPAAPVAGAPAPGAGPGDAVRPAGGKPPEARPLPTTLPPALGAAGAR
jgi:pilus assembly protein CpaC